MRSIHHVIGGELSYTLFTKENLNPFNNEYDTFHCHSGVEFLFIHKGRGKVIIDGEIYPFCDDTFIIFQPFQLHGLIVDKESTYLRSVVVFEHSSLEKYMIVFPKLLRFLETIVETHLNNQVMYQPPKILSEHYAFQKEKTVSGSYTGQMEEGGALFLLSVLSGIMKESRMLYKKECKTVIYDEIVAQILSHIEQNYTKPYSAEQLSKKLMISKYHMLHTFKERMGITISEYMIQKRIREAKYQLATSTGSIENISETLGFGSASYFCRIFKKYTGMTPYQYRKQYQAMLSL